MLLALTVASVLANAALRSCLGSLARYLRASPEPCWCFPDCIWPLRSRGSMDELRAAFASPPGRATAEDAARLRELAPIRSMIFTVDDLV